MALELIAAIVAAVAIAGLVMTLRKVTGGRLPRWIVPAAAGLGLLGFTVWNEYDWFDRVTGRLPETARVAWANSETSPLRPWSYVFPLTTRFSAVDIANLRRARDAAGAEVVVADVYLYARWQPVGQVPVALDCAGARQAELIGPGGRLTADGLIEGAVWHAVPADDPILRTACDGG